MISRTTDYINGQSFFPREKDIPCIYLNFWLREGTYTVDEKTCFSGGSWLPFKKKIICFSFKSNRNPTVSPKGWSGTLLGREDSAVSRVLTQHIHLASSATDLTPLHVWKGKCCQLIYEKSSIVRCIPISKMWNVGAMCIFGPVKHGKIKIMNFASLMRFKILWDGIPWWSSG